MTTTAAQQQAAYPTGIAHHGHFAAPGPPGAGGGPVDTPTSTPEVTEVERDCSSSFVSSEADADVELPSSHACGAIDESATQPDSDCGSSSGVGGSGMAGKHESGECSSDASSLDGRDSRDSSGVPPMQDSSVEDATVPLGHQHLHHHHHHHLRHIPQQRLSNGPGNGRGPGIHHQGPPALLQHQVYHPGYQTGYGQDGQAIVQVPLIPAQFAYPPPPTVYPPTQPHPPTTTAPSQWTNNQNNRATAPPPPLIGQLPPLRPLYTMTVPPTPVTIDPTSGATVNVFSMATTAGGSASTPATSAGSNGARSLVNGPPGSGNSNLSLGNGAPTTPSTSVNGTGNGQTNVLPGNGPSQVTSMGGPTNNGSHDVFVHVQNGETISLLIGSDVRHINGPATIRMIGHSCTNPNALPLRVPQGHLVQQILDEQGRLKHVILSPQMAATNNVTAPAAAAAAAAARGPTPVGVGASSVPVPASVIAAAVAGGGPGISPTTTGSAATSGVLPMPVASSTPLNSYGRQDISASTTPIKITTGLPQLAAIPSTSNGTGATYVRASPGLWANPGATTPKRGGNGTGLVPLLLPPGLDPLYATGAGSGLLPAPTALIPTGQPPLVAGGAPIHAGYNGLVTQAGPVAGTDDSDDRFDFEEDDREKLRETLNSIQQPQIVSVMSTEVEISWQEIDTSEAGASGGPFPQIDASEFTYEIFIYEVIAPTRVVSQQLLDSTHTKVIRMTRLKPDTDYLVSIRASLPERDLYGYPSGPAHFRSMQARPDPPRIGNRGPTWLNVSWRGAGNGAQYPIKAYIVQVAKGKNEGFVTVYEGPNEMTRITSLEPNTTYRVRLIIAFDYYQQCSYTDPGPPAYAQTSQSNLALIGQDGSSAATTLHHAHHRGAPSGASIMSNSTQVLSPPKLVGVFNRAIKVIWSPVYSINSYTLEYSDNRGNDFIPVDNSCYLNNGCSANVSNLQSNREYYFRLVVRLENGQELRSDVVYARTRRDQFENSNYLQQQQHQQQQQQQQQQSQQSHHLVQQPQQQQSLVHHHQTHQSQMYSNTGGQGSSYYERPDRLQIPTHLQRINVASAGENDIVELVWRYSGREFDALAFVLEGAVTAEGGIRLQSEWKIIYKGQKTVATVTEPDFCIFRVQAVNTRKSTTGPWSDVLVIKRRPRQASIPPPTIVTPVSAPQPLVKKAPPPEPLPACTLPKFSNIKATTLEVQWSVVEQEKSDSTPSSSLIYELQRIDTQPIIVYSGDQCQCTLENLKPIEHVQVRARVVIVDYEGKRREGEWSPIASTCTACAVPSQPLSLRLATTSGQDAVNALVWDSPTEVNGADVKQYVIRAKKASLREPSESEASEGEPSTPSIAEETTLAETSKTEFVLDKLEAATRYSFHVVAINKAGESPASDEFVYDSPAVAPEPPERVHAKPSGSNSLTVSWLPGEDNGSALTAFVVDVAELTASAAKQAVVSEHQLGPDTTTFVVKELKPKTRYQVSVASENSEGRSKAVFVTAETYVSPPPPPELLLVQAQSNLLKLRWQYPAPGLTSPTCPEPIYFVLERENDNGTFSPVFEGEARSAKVKNLKESTIHRFRIRGSHARANAALTGAWSHVYEFSTTKQPPQAVRQAPTVTELGPTTFRFEWPSVRSVTNVSGPSNNNDEDDETACETFYRLEVAPKSDRRNAVGPWKTIYEGQNTTYTYASTSASTRLARVVVVERTTSTGAELASPTSPTVTFPVPKTPTESPRRRVKSSAPTAASGSAGNAAATTSSGSSSGTETPRSPSTLHRAHRMGFYRRLRRSWTTMRTTCTERNGALVVMLAFFAFALTIAIILNNYYQL